MEKRFVRLTEIVEEGVMRKRAIDLNYIVGFYENGVKNTVVEICGNSRFVSGDCAQEESIRAIHVLESFEDVAKLTML